MAARIQRIQPISITITAGNLTATATITSIDTTKAILIWDGVIATTASQSAHGRCAVRIAVTNDTTVTATRENSTDEVTVKATVVEFSSGVNSIQAGTIAMSTVQASNTATVSAVGANAFVLLLGATSAQVNMGFADVQGAVVLTDTTTVTASCTLLTALTVGYMVVDLDSSLVTAVQQFSVAESSSTSSQTDTITSLTTGNALLFYRGILTDLGIGVANSAQSMTIASATTVTRARTGTGTASRTSHYTLVSFAAGCLNGSVQRGTIALAAAASNTATISAVTTTLAFVNWGNFRGTSVNANIVLPSLVLTDATTVTAALSSAGTITAAYEVIQFAAASATRRLPLLGVG